jgi:hypothetical protein
VSENRLATRIDRLDAPIIVEIGQPIARQFMTLSITPLDSRIS